MRPVKKEKKDNTYKAIIDTVDGIDWHKIDKKIKGAIVRACKQIAPHQFTLLKDIVIFKNVQSNNTTNGKYKQVRFGLAPEIVVIVASSQYWEDTADTLNYSYYESSQTSQIANFWLDNTSAEVYVMDISRGLPTVYNYTVEDSKNLRQSHNKIDSHTIARWKNIADVWSDAIGYTFSAPLYRDGKQHRQDNLQYSVKAKFSEHRTDAENRNYDGLTSLSTRTETFNKDTIVSDEELFNFMKTLLYYKQHDIEEFIMDNIIYCPICKRPMRNNTRYCRWCDWENPMYFPCNFYYEDTNSDYECIDEEY